MARTVPASFTGRDPAALLPRASIETSDLVDVVQATNYTSAYDVPCHWSTEHSTLDAVGAKQWAIVDTGAAWANHLAVLITTGLVAGAGDVSITVFLEALVTLAAFDVRVEVYTLAGALVNSNTGVLAVGAPSNTTVSVDSLDPDTDYVVIVGVRGAGGGASCTLYRTACYDDDRVAADLPG